MSRKQGELADQNAQLRKTGMKACRRKASSNLTGFKYYRFGNQSLMRDCNGSPRNGMANTRMRCNRRRPTMKCEIRKRHLGQDQDSGKQHQLEDQNNQLPAFHLDDTTKQKVRAQPYPVNLTD